MISYQHRFHGFRSLSFVYKSGQISRGPMFAVKAAANPRRTDWRGAVVISRKVHKSAVSRNRMRRRLYEALGALGDDINGPYDIVISVFNDRVLEETAISLRRQLRKQLKEAGVLKPVKRFPS